MPLELPPERELPLLEGALNELERLREELLNESFELFAGALRERDELLRSREEFSGCIQPRVRRDCFGET